MIDWFVLALGIGHWALGIGSVAPTYLLFEEDWWLAVGLWRLRFFRDGDIMKKLMGGSEWGKVLLREV